MSDGGPDTREITEETDIEEVVSRKPGAVKLLMREGARCVRCGEPVWDKLGPFLEENGKDEAERKRIIREINDL